MLYQKDTINKGLLPFMCKGRAYAYYIYAIKFALSYLSHIKNPGKAGIIHFYSFVKEFHRWMQ